MACRIDCSGGGKDADACKQGAETFRDRHPELDWSINGGRNGAGQLVLNIGIPGEHARPIPVAPIIDMKESVLMALEQVFVDQNFERYNVGRSPWCRCKRCGQTMEPASTAAHTCAINHGGPVSTRQRGAC